MATTSKWFLLVLAFATAAGADDKAKDTSKDLDKLKGTWDIKSMEARGREITPPGDSKLSMVFEKDTMTMKGPQAANGAGGQPEFPSFRIKLDESKSPRTIVMEMLTGPHTGEKGTGIYKFEGDELWLCLPNGADEETPKEFKTTPETKHALMKLARAKDDAKKSDAK